MGKVNTNIEGYNLNETGKWVNDKLHEIDNKATSEGLQQAVSELREELSDKKEFEALENDVKTHKTSVILDHPDGSVTKAKLSAEIQTNLDTINTHTNQINNINDKIYGKSVDIDFIYEGTGAPSDSVQNLLEPYVYNTNIDDAAIDINLSGLFYIAGKPCGKMDTKRVSVGGAGGNMFVVVSYNFDTEAIEVTSSISFKEATVSDNVWTFTFAQYTVTTINYDEWDLRNYTGTDKWVGINISSWEASFEIPFIEKNTWGISAQYSITSLQNDLESLKSNQHTHSNKALLDTITADRVDKWDNGGNITVDSTLSTTSTNPIQNKAVAQKIDDISSTQTSLEQRITALETSLPNAISEQLQQQIAEEVTQALIEQMGGNTVYYEDTDIEIDDIE